MNDYYFIFTPLTTQSYFTQISELDSTIIAAVIAVAGIVIGAILTLLAQLLLNGIENKRNTKKQIFEKQMEIYPLALEYIYFYAQLQEKIKNKDSVRSITAMTELEKEKYIQFYYTFSIISSTKTVDRFNKLRNQIKTDQISPEEAYEKLRILLQKD